MVAWDENQKIKWREKKKKLAVFCWKMLVWAIDPNIYRRWMIKKICYSQKKKRIIKIAISLRGMTNSHSAVFRLTFSRFFFLNRSHGWTRHQPHLFSLDCISFLFLASCYNSNNHIKLTEISNANSQISAYRVLKPLTGHQAK